MPEISIDLTTTKKHYSWLLGLCMIICLNSNSEAQRVDKRINPADTTFLKGEPIDFIKKEKKHSPHKATFYAAILPGLGQAYNKKYWKIPILYAGIGGLAYAIHFNTKFYKDYRAAYRDFIIRDPANKSYLQFLNPNMTEKDLEVANTAQWFQEALNSKKRYYRRYRDLSYIGMVGLYVLQMVDAAVDAHFYNFDISDDLSMQVTPSVMPPAPGEFTGMGLQVKLKF